MKPEIQYFLVCIFAAIIFGSISGFATYKLLSNPSNQTRIADFYATENAVGVSPADYVANTSIGLAVDLRDSASYNQQHLEGSINIPAEQMTDQQVVDAFEALPKNQTPIVYCYSAYCMLSVETGNLLAQNGIYVKHMNLGWAEIQQDFPGYLINETSTSHLIANKTNITGCTTNSQGLGC